MEEYIEKMYIYVVEYYSAIKEWNNGISSDLVSLLV